MEAKFLWTFKISEKSKIWYVMPYELWLSPSVKDSKFVTMLQHNVVPTFSSIIMMWDCPRPFPEFMFKNRSIFVSICHSSSTLSFFSDCRIMHLYCKDTKISYSYAVHLLYVLTISSCIIFEQCMQINNSGKIISMFKTDLFKSTSLPWLRRSWFCVSLRSATTSKRLPGRLELCWITPSDSIWN